MHQEERKATQFKAKPAKILTKEPFKPILEHSHSTLTNVHEFSLNTSKRAAERQVFEQFKKETQEEKEMIMQQVQNIIDTFICFVCIF